MDDLSTTDIEKQTIVIVPVFTRRTVEITEINVPEFNAGIEQAMAALGWVGIDLSESIREAVAKIGLVLMATSFYGDGHAPSAPTTARGFGTWMTNPLPDDAWGSGSFRRLTTAQREEEFVAQAPRSAREFLIQKRERARLTQRKQLRDRVKPWEERGKRFR